MSQTQKINWFSEASQKLLKDMNQTEIFELCENSAKLQCPDLQVLFTEIWIFFADVEEIWSTGEVLHHFKRTTSMSIRPLATLRSPVEDQSMVHLRDKMMFFKAKDMLRKAKKKNCTTILANWKAEERYWSSLKEHDIGEKEIILYDQIAFEKHDCTATKVERIRFSQKWALSLKCWRVSTTSTATLDDGELQKVADFTTVCPKSFWVVVHERGKCTKRLTHQRIRELPRNRLHCFHIGSLWVSFFLNHQCTYWVTRHHFLFWLDQILPDSASDLHCLRAELHSNSTDWLFRTQNSTFGFSVHCVLVKTMQLVPQKLSDPLMNETCVHSPLSWTTIASCFPEALWANRDEVSNFLISPSSMLSIDSSKCIWDWR